MHPSRCIFAQSATANIALLDLRVQGIVITGGCALNVVLNMRVRRELGYPVYVPAAPNDGGLSIGAVWLAHPPAATAPHQPLTFLGPPLWDGAVLQERAALRQARRVGVAELATLLAEGSIVAVVRGRSEVGPRALGHRSLLAVPGPDAKRRLNRLKVREWWRPVAPMVAVEATFAHMRVAEGGQGHGTSSDKSKSGHSGNSGMTAGGLDVFAEGFWSPYMSFAPRMLPGAQQNWPVPRAA